jgi:hypothetical protein
MHHLSINIWNKTTPQQTQKKCVQNKLFQCTIRHSKFGAKSGLKKHTKATHK